MVDLHHQPMCIGSHRRTGQGQHLIPSPGGVAGVHNNRQMALFFNHRHGGQIQGVATVMDKGAHAPLTQDHLVVSMGHDVFGSHEPLVDSGGHAPFEQDRSVGFPCPLEQAEILHVPGTDLQHVGIMLHQVEGLKIHHFGDHRQT